MLNISGVTTSRVRASGFSDGIVLIRSLGWPENQEPVNGGEETPHLASPILLFNANVLGVEQTLA
jgi:hypothetical protein